MAQQTINIGAAPDDGTGDTIRVGGDKINDNFTELYAADAALGTAATLDVDTDGTLTADSDSLIATQKAVKTYVDTEIAGVGGSGGVDVEDEGVSEATGATTLNFTGAGVTATDMGGGVVDVAIPGGSGGTIVFGVEIDGGGSTITTGTKGFVRIPAAHTITKVTTLSTDAAVTSCSITVDVWRDSYANFPPTSGDKISASAPATLSSATKSEDSTLTGWSTSGSAGDVYGFSVASVTGAKKILIEIEATV